MIEVRLVNGKPVGIAGRSDHPIGRGALCPKGSAVLQQTFHPDRLQHPMARKNRGSQEWERISWGDAENLMRFHLEKLIEGRRPESLAMIAGPQNDLRREILRRFAAGVGTPHFWKWEWSPAQLPLDAFDRMHGSSEGLFYDLPNASLLVSFGWDWLQAFPSPVEAQRAFGRLRNGRRGRILQIEPRLSISAAKADEWISARDGSAGALALSLAHVMMEERLYDRAFVERWTEGFEAYRAVVRDYAPDRASRLSGVSVERIVALAREMAQAKTALAVISRGSLFDQIAVHSLNALTGSIGAKGGVLAAGSAEKSEALPAPEAKSSILTWEQIPEAVLARRESPVGMLWLDGVNPAFSSPQPSQWREAMSRIPFIVSFSTMMSETSELADLVLPTSEALEAPQDETAFDLEGNRVDTFAPAVMAPLYDTADMGDFVLGLARRMGGRVTRHLPWAHYAEALRHRASRRGWNASMIAQGGAASTPALRQGPGAVLEGRRMRLAQEELANSDASPKGEHRGLDLHIQFPLAFLYAEGAHLPYLHGLDGIRGDKLGEGWVTTVELHPATARRLGIEEGSAVWVESASGRIQAKVRVFEGAREDTASIPMGLGHTAMGRYAKGVGSNPAEIVPREFNFAGRALWRAEGVKVYAV